MPGLWLSLQPEFCPLVSINDGSLTNVHTLFFTLGSQCHSVHRLNISYRMKLPFNTTKVFKMLPLLCCLPETMSLFAFWASLCCSSPYLDISRTLTNCFLHLLCDMKRALLSVWEKMVHRHWAQFQKSSFVADILVICANALGLLV